MKANECARAVYRDSISDDLKPYILHDFLGVSVRRQMENGDFTFSIEDVRAGIFSGFRSVPPLAPANSVRVGHKITREEEYTVPISRYHELH